MELETGNAGEVDTNGTGWFIGFSDWTDAGDANLRHIPSEIDARVLRQVVFAPCRGSERRAQVICEERTVAIQVGLSGSFRIEFCPSKFFTRRIVEKPLTHCFY